MKYSFAMGLALLVWSASAMAVTKPLLSFTSTNASIDPTFRMTRICDVYTNKVVRALRGGATRPGSTETQVAFTSTFPNAQSLKDAIVASAQGKLVRLPIGPIGGPTSTYVAFRRGRKVALKQEGFKRVRNDATEAQSLVRFLDFNCKAQ